MLTHLELFLIHFEDFARCDAVLLFKVRNLLKEMLYGVRVNAIRHLISRALDLPVARDECRSLCWKN
jgi:hypothetical protein